MLSFTEENYLKALYKITVESGYGASGTNELADALDVKPASANDMLKKLKAKKLVDYEKYGKISLTASGRRNAIAVLRNHRLWETFLYEKLGFSWDEVHEVAEQLEHTHSTKLIDRLDEFLGHPEYDPHGDPIPSKSGKFKVQSTTTLLNVAVGETRKVVAVKDNSSSFLQYVAKVGLAINSVVTVAEKQEYDAITVLLVKGKRYSVGQKFLDNILVV
jgi:DtxR family Mn-dependent transcriptional regulator